MPDTDPHPKKGFNTPKLPKKITPLRDMISFSWGGNTQEWEEEADQVMHILQDQLDDQISDEELQNQIDYALRWNYWH